FFYDSSNDISETEEFLDRWNFAGNKKDIQWSPSHGVPYFPDGLGNPACLAQAPTADLQKTLAALDTTYQKAVKENDAKTMNRILAKDFLLVIGARTTPAPHRALSRLPGEPA
ncbi:hypothetical protein B4Q13_24875, partial [Lacticaseibacillus rhamnosus]